MKISRFVKAIIYQTAAVVLLAVTVYLLLLMRTEGGLESAYFLSNRYIFIIAAGLLGTGVYSFYAYSRRHREHTFDSLFLLLIGLVLMIVSVTAIVVFGGLNEPFTGSGFTAVNVNILALSFLPIPFFVRGFVLALDRNRDKLSLRRAALTASAVAAAALLLAFAFGEMFRTVHYPQDSSYSSAYTDESNEEQPVL